MKWGSETTVGQSPSAFIRLPIRLAPAPPVSALSHFTFSREFIRRSLRSAMSVQRPAVGGQEVCVCLHA